MTTNASTTLDTLVREQATILLDLSTLSERQAEAIASRDADRLDDVLDRRQTLITRLGEVAGELADRSNELERLTARGDGLAERAARDLAEASRLWSQLAARDADDLADLRRQRDDLARELAAVGKTERAKGAYGAPASGGALFQDFQA
ncbi:MAG: hypothetical protein HEQ23_06550 [Tepidisphaera sp.]|jgi:DNA repair exonuclease SbcCD ATPase subunit